MYRVGRGMEAGCRGSFTIGAFLDACSRSRRLRASSEGRGRSSLSLTEGEAAEVFSRLWIMPVASKETEGIKSGECLCAKDTGLRTSTSTHRSESVVNK